MKLSPITLGPVSLPTPAPSATAGIDSVPRPPARWSQWWTSPIASVDCGTGTRASAWHEAWIPADRGFTGDLRPSVTFGGSSREAAIAAAHVLAAQGVDVELDLADGGRKTVSIHPAIAVLQDARNGAFWLAPLRTTVRSRGEWVDAPHSIDGDAFTGAAPILRTPTVLSATKDMVAVVGRDTVITPSPWTDAPDDSQLD